MARTWMNEGKPLADGRFCLVIDPEDGTQPLRVWGHTKDEVLDKTAKTVEHGARTITTLRAQITPASSPPASAERTAHETAAPERTPTRLTAGEQIQLTADLSNPSKAPAAATRLIEHHTGIDFKKIQQQETVERIARIQANWSHSHPEFPRHPINYKLLNDAATIRAGGYENITGEIMDQVFTELLAAGLLVDAADEEEPPPPPTVPPEENPVSRTVRPRGAASYRRTITSPAPPAASLTPKYTREQIEKMPSDEYRRKLESDPEFVTSIAALAGKPPTGTA
jgi:hypothetical protein